MPFWRVLEKRTRGRDCGGFIVLDYVVVLEKDDGRGTTFEHDCSAKEFASFELGHRVVMSVTAEVKE